MENTTNTINAATAADATTAANVTTTTTTQAAQNAGTDAGAVGSFDGLDAVLDAAVSSYTDALAGRVETGEGAPEDATEQASDAEAEEAEETQRVAQTQIQQPAPTPEALGFDSSEDAQIAAALYREFTSDRFNPDSFLNSLAQFAPSRVNAIINSVVSSTLPVIREHVVKTLFGDQASTQEVEEFRRWKQAGGVLGILGNDDNDIPEALRFNPDGTEKSPEEIEFLRSLKKQAREAQRIVEERKAEEARRAAAERHALLAKVENDYTNRFSAAVESSLARLASQAPPEFRAGLKYAVLGLFGSVPENAQLFSEGLRAAIEGDAIRASRAAKEVEKRLVLLTNAFVNRMKSAFSAPVPVQQQPAQQRQQPPKIQQAASTTKAPAQRSQIDTRSFVEQKIRELKARGLL